MGNAPTTLAPKGEVLEEVSRKTVIDPEDPNKTPITFESLYKGRDGPIVFKFLRRFGCVLCREGAAEMSKLKPLLEEKYGKDSVTWIGIGLEREGYEEFKKGNFFDGKIYLDEPHELYRAAGFVTFGTLGMVGKLITSGALRQAVEAGKKGFEGNMRGNKTQLGGVLILSPKGEVLYYFKQESFGDEPMKEEVIKAIENYFVADKGREEIDRIGGTGKEKLDLMEPSAV
jgi:prostamide/prostaglandin F2alpha synthase